MSQLQLIYTKVCN